MSHLGDRLSALVDGELDGAEQDKATAHLARCEQCRAEAAALRDLKRQLRSLVADSPEVAAAEADLMRRLMEVTGFDGARPGRRRRPGPARRPGRRTMRPPGPGGADRPSVGRMFRQHRRYVVLGTMSIVVSLGTAAFTAGGGDPEPGPRITPQMELYSEEHAITTGEIPFAGTQGTADPGSISADLPGMSTSAVLPAAAPSGTP